MNFRAKIFKFILYYRITITMEKLEFIPKVHIPKSYPDPQLITFVKVLLGPVIGKVHQQLVIAKIVR